MDRPSSLLWRPATTHILVGGLVVLLVGLVIAYIISTFQPTVPLRIGSGVYHLWVADTEGERAQGLSGVPKLKPSGGLLMKYDTDAEWGIWMKDMEIPLDIIWLDKDKKVVHIVKDAAPELSTDVTFTPPEDARYVVELSAGSAKKAGIKKGATALFDETDPGRLW